MPVYDLKSRNILITGGSRGLGALTAEYFAAEGCNIAINYNSAADRAIALQAKLEKEHGVKAVALQGDVGVQADCYRLVDEAVAQLGGLDIIVSNAGWTRVGPMADLNALTEADWDKCYAVNVKANLHLMQRAAPIFNANAHGGALLISSSIAGSQPSGSSMAYAVSKAAGLHMMRCMAAHLGPKIRVNAVQPGLLLTEWGLGLPEQARAATVQKSTLKDVCSVEECAAAFVMMAKSGAMTGTALKIDAGLWP